MGLRQSKDYWVNGCRIDYKKETMKCNFCKVCKHPDLEGDMLDNDICNRCKRKMRHVKTRRPKTQSKINDVYINRSISVSIPSLTI